MQVDLRIVCEGAGNFKGKSFVSASSPPIMLENSRSCRQFDDFVTDTIVLWVSAGVLAVWGEVGSCTPPKLVLPLTVELSKPHSCHDE